MMEEGAIVEATAWSSVQRAGGASGGSAGVGYDLLLVRCGSDGVPWPAALVHARESGDGGCLAVPAVADLEEHTALFTTDVRAAVPPGAAIDAVAWGGAAETVTVQFIDVAFASISVNISSLDDYFNETDSDRWYDVRGLLPDSADMARLFEEWADKEEITEDGGFESAVGDGGGRGGRGRGRCGRGGRSGRGGRGLSGGTSPGRLTMKTLADTLERVVSRLGLDGVGPRRGELRGSGGGAGCACSKTSFPFAAARTAWAGPGWGRWTGGGARRGTASSLVGRRRAASPSAGGRLGCRRTSSPLRVRACRGRASAGAAAATCAQPAGSGGGGGARWRRGPGDGDARAGRGDAGPAQEPSGGGVRARRDGGCFR